MLTRTFPNIPNARIRGELVRDGVSAAKFTTLKKFSTLQ